jgi:ABC-type branched-subunit amino acid transport system permease subunit
LGSIFILVTLLLPDGLVGLVQKYRRNAEGEVL